MTDLAIMISSSVWITGPIAQVGLLDRLPHGGDGRLTDRGREAQAEAQSLESIRRPKGSAPVGQAERRRSP